MGFKQIKSESVVQQIIDAFSEEMRYQSVKDMIESGRGEELYKAHADLLEVLKTRNTENLNVAVRNSYFDQIEPVEI